MCFHTSMAGLCFTTCFPGMGCSTSGESINSPSPWMSPLNVLRPLKGSMGMKTMPSQMQLAIQRGSTLLHRQMRARSVSPINIIM